MPQSASGPTSNGHQSSFTSEDAQAVYALAAADTPLSAQVRHALQVIDNALNSYENEEIAVSFNGGKDCTVLLHLICAAMFHRAASAPSTSTSPPCLNAIYVRCDSPFPQVEEFIELSCAYYNLSLHTITSDMRSALTTYQNKYKPKVKAVIVGTRRSDPHGRELGDTNRTDVEKGWPDLMRVHPILDWSYQTVWDFLRADSLSKNGHKGVPYCNLYDYGYTSLGSTHDTFPNPNLRSPDHMSLWKPAYMLADESMERAGREGAIPVQKHETGQEEPVSASI